MKGLSNSVIAGSLRKISKYFRYVNLFQVAYPFWAIVALRNPLKRQMGKNDYNESDDVRKGTLSKGKQPRPHDKVLNIP